MELIQPMEPILRDKVQENEGYIHQVKWDGIRGLTYLFDKQVRIFTKRGKERTAFYPEIHEISNLFEGKTAVMDGEIIVLDDGRPSFSHILMRERVRSIKRLPYYKEKYPVLYVLFDIMFFNDKDIRSLPLYERQEILTNHISKSSSITLTDNFDDGDALFNLMKDKTFEGIVSKKIDSKYYAGKKHDSWYKTKIFNKLLTVVGGITWKDNFPNAMMVGIYQNEQCYHIANVRIGLSQHDLYQLKNYTKELEQSVSPFVNLKKGESVSWFRPVMTCWVSFLEWTHSGSLRHPKLIGFSKQSSYEANGRVYTL